MRINLVYQEGDNPVHDEIFCDLWREHNDFIKFYRVPQNYNSASTTYDECELLSQYKKDAIIVMEFHKE